MIPKQSRPSFTLIELLIVIAIIIFLAKLILPRYTTLFAKARQTEVVLNLSNLFAAEQAYYIQNGRFTANFKELDWQPKGYTGNQATTHNSYTYGVTNPTGAEGVSIFTGSSQTPSTALAGSQVTNDSFIIKAALKTNDTAEIWSLDHTGDIKKETP